jgi:HD-GYP domain-containing protein (c-di-GMP phosphodiesterase class II)
MVRRSNMIIPTSIIVGVLSTLIGKWMGMEDAEVALLSLAAALAALQHHERMDGTGYWIPP